MSFIRKLRSILNETSITCPNCYCNNDKDQNPWYDIFKIDVPILVGKDNISNFCCICDELKEIAKKDEEKYEKIIKMSKIKIPIEKAKKLDPYFGEGKDLKKNETVTTGAIATMPLNIQNNTKKKKKKKKNIKEEKSFNKNKIKTYKLISPKKTWDEYPQDELKKGIKVEKEHTKDEEIAAIIAANHLDEIDDYYSELEKIEKGHH